MAQPDVKRHRQITTVLLDGLDNLDLDDDNIRQRVNERFGKDYKGGEWKENKHVRWNRRYVYTTIRLLEHRAKYGPSPNAQSVTEDWCNPGSQKKWLVGLVLVAEQLDVGVFGLENSYFYESYEWAKGGNGCRGWFAELSERDPSDRQRIRSAMKRKVRPCDFLHKTVDVPLRKLWRNPGP